jgi:hypothetical protein
VIYPLNYHLFGCTRIPVEIIRRSTIDELVDEQCPVCEEETFVAEDTGAIA